MHKLQYFLLFCLVTICINGESHRALCGSRLIDFLSIVCEGSYNRPKKSGNDIYAYAPAEQIDSAAIECRNLKLLEQFNNENKREREMTAMVPARFPFQNRANAFDFGHFARDRRSITQECCQKSCTLSEMRSYCS